jgi:type I restriction enzyme R subunit
VIHRLRANQPSTATDLEELEKMLVEIGQEDGQSLLARMLAQSQAPTLVHLVRGLVGMDRAQQSPAPVIDMLPENLFAELVFV